MTRPLRSTNPEYVHLVSIRTREARLLLTPTKRNTEMIGGVIARYQELFGIKLHAYCFLGNHYHLLLTAPRGNLWRFEQSVNRELSRRVNRQLGREGSIWSRRYDGLNAPEPKDIIEGLLYVTLNAVHHGLVYHPNDWPGLQCFDQLRTGRERDFKFINYTDYYRAKLRNRSVSVLDFASTHTLRLSPLPQFGTTLEEQWQIIKPLLEERMIEYRKKNKLTTDSLKGVDYAKQSPFSRPKNIKRANRPSCYSKSAQTIKVFKQITAAIRALYNKASLRCRAGLSDYEFPPFTLKPPLHCVPMTAPA